MADEEKQVPTIILKLNDAEIFNIEVDIQTPSLYVARAMLGEALHTVQSLIEDANAAAFGERMQRIKRVQESMQKPSLIRQ